MHHQHPMARVTASHTECDHRSKLCLDNGGHNSRSTCIQKLLRYCNRCHHQHSTARVTASRTECDASGQTVPGPWRSKCKGIPVFVFDLLL
ncbi:hypothetical protein AVEN_172673-1 [Araneus ventricosus]|uniref:Uncharacterized protein n=1 Tax=Araneus ventricosus TaxID=182803 RepID=A0A4Y2L3R7_ARAVE|nr:hypothetical protein AVEN_172673-1 [Araneus ventricosus]